ncbi:hypothetical protein BG003_008013 [Podila horticola]|nr:hypothetical protein BG003_008013 [Podila horticola]
MFLGEVQSGKSSLIEALRLYAENQGDIYSQIAVILKAAVSLHSIHLVLFTTANDPFTEHIQFVLKA